MSRDANLRSGDRASSELYYWEHYLPQLTCCTWGLGSFALGRGAVLGISRNAVNFSRVGNQIQIRENLLDCPVLQVLATLPLVIMTYVEIFVMPWLAGPAHPVRFVIARNLESFYGPLAALLLLGLVGYLMLRENIHSNYYLFCIVWWATTILPALNLNQVISLVQDRYEYIPSVGLCILAAHLLVTLASNGAGWKKAVAVGLGAFIAIQSIALWRIERTWHDNPAMIARCVQFFRIQYFIENNWPPYSGVEATLRVLRGS